MGATEKQKSPERPEWEQGEEGAMVTSKIETGPVLQQQAASAGSGAPLSINGEQDNRIQPWQSLMDEIERESSLSPPGSDYFPCQDGFYAHSLAG